MKKIFFLSFFLLLISCNKTKTVLICGDHVCVNKTEANQFFEENLILEVKIINPKTSKKPDLVELNLKKASSLDKKIQIKKIKNTNKKIKVLSKKEIKEKKKAVKEKKIAQKISKNSNTKVLRSNKKKRKKIFSSKKVDNIENIKVVDVCTIIEKCNIDQISKYLIKQGKNKNFPDIAYREK